MNPYTQDTLLAYAGLAVLVLGFAAGLIGLRWLWRRTSGGSSEEIAGMRERLEELEAERGRVAELEQRVDFAERMLAQVQSEGALPRGEAS